MPLHSHFIHHHPDTTDPTGPANSWQAVDAAKAPLRARMKAAINSLSASERAVQSARICSAIAALPAWQAARCVLVFAPMPSEPDIAPLARALLTRALSDTRAPVPCRVCLPAIDWTTKVLTPVEVTNWASDLVAEVGGVGGGGAGGGSGGGRCCATHDPGPAP